MALARWRPPTPEWMPEPQTVFTLLLALLASEGDGLAEVFRAPTAKPQALPCHASGLSGFLVGAAFGQLPQDDLSPPIEIHASIMLKIIFSSILRGRARGRCQLTQVASIPSDSTH